MLKTKITPLYERLPHDDEPQGESNSISNQKAIRAILEYSRNNRAEFVRTVQETQAAQQASDISKKKKRLANACRAQAEEMIQHELIYSV